MQKEYRNDRAWLTLNVEADLRSVFHWNTKQVTFSSEQLLFLARIMYARNFVQSVIVYRSPSPGDLHRYPVPSGCIAGIRRLYVLY